MGVFGNIGKAFGTKGGRYLVPGLFEVKIKKCIQTKDRKGVDMFIAELEIMKTSVPEQIEIGAEVSYLVKLDKDPALGNIADFMRAGLAALAAQQGEFIERDDVDLDEDDAASICGEENILVGLILDVEAFNKPTKEGKDFTRVNFNVQKDVHNRLRASQPKLTKGSAEARA